MRKAAIFICMALTALAGGLRLTPDPAPFRQLTFSHAFLAENGALLRLTTAGDGRYRLWTPLADFAESLVRATLAKEDRRFHYHLGVDPFALGRAAFGQVTGSGSTGASTLTMQLARLIWRLETRSVFGKMRQIAYAFGLEARWSKAEILEAYLNLAPYGGNVEGAGAASWLYFGKAPMALTEPESLRLALLPQSPGTRVAALTSFGQVRASEKASALVLALALRPSLVEAKALVKEAYQLEPRDRNAMPWRAPHLVERLRRQLPSPPARQSGAVVTSIDLGMQDLVERAVSRHLESFSKVGIENAAVLVVHHPTMRTRAYAGSADFNDRKLDGQVDGIRARRSPGSTLKPLLYAQALDKGIIHPLSLVLDLPSGFGSYDPENFDKSFSGPIDATSALVKSRNVPAIDLLNLVTASSFHDMLTRGGVRFRSDAKHYGLTLAIGGAEVTMEELAVLYGAMAGDGKARPLRLVEAGERAAGTPMLTAEAAFLARTMLSRNPRPGERGAGQRGVPARRATLEVAWKTGTSFGLRDAWAVAVVGEWVIAVWLGDFKGRPNSYLIGRDTAGPLLFKVIDALAAERADATSAPLAGAPRKVRRVQVCALSGNLPGAACSVLRETWFIPGVSPVHTCSLHKMVSVDATTGRRICATAGAGARDGAVGRKVVQRAFEFWPTDALRAFARLGVPRRGPPPFEAGCGARVAQAKASSGVQILSPRKNLIYPVPVETGRSADPILLAARAATDAGRIYWFLDESLLGETAPGETLAWTPKPGKWVVRAVDQLGAADAREVEVIAVR